MATINGTSGNDSLTGGPPADDIYGGAGNDTLRGGGGNDTIYGGADNDSLFGDGGNDLIYGDAGNDTAFGGNNSDTIYGGDGADSLSGDAGDDRLFGGAGNDTLAGGAGADLLSGGQGLDYADYSASNAAVNINLSTGAVSGGHAQGDRLRGVDGIIGSAFDDTIVGFDGESNNPADAYTNVFFGGAGNDVLSGLGGGDSLYGGADQDTIFGGDGNDLVDGGTGNDSLIGDAGNDSIFGGDGADTAFGGTGNDSIDGGAGNDSLDGGTGNDTVLGGDGNDTVFGGTGADSIDGGAGDDSLFGGDDADTILGGIGNDTLFGGSGNDSLSGGDGLDSIDGGAGNDTLFGGAGADTMTGGAGADLMLGGDDQDTFIVDVGAHGFGDTIDGGEGGVDNDVLDLTGAGPLRIVYGGGNNEAGVVQFLDGPGGNVIGTLTFSNIETIVPCFTPGTMILTPTGDRPVETLRVGDLVETRDRGPQPIRWIGDRRLTRAEALRCPHLAPVRIARGALGPDLPEADLVVSPRHRVLVAGPRAELLFGDEEVLVAAVHLVGRPGITRVPPGPVRYLHLMFDRHEIVCSDGLWSESFQPGDRTLAGMDAPQRAELEALFPGIAAASRFVSARRSLKAHEARVLLAS